MLDGVFYIAKVTDNELPVSFRLTQCADGVAVFENPKYDAPRRITYRRPQVAPKDPGAVMEVTLDGPGMKAFTLVFTRH